MKTPSGKSKQKSVKPLQASLLSKAKELKYNLDTRTAGVKARNKKVVSKTFHKAGIVVPLDANDVGYRPLTVTDGEWLIPRFMGLLLLHRTPCQAYYPALFVGYLYFEFPLVYRVPLSCDWLLFNTSLSAVYIYVYMKCFVVR